LKEAYAGVHRYWGDWTGKPLPALHPVELLDASIRGVDAADLLAHARR